MTVTMTMTMTIRSLTICPAVDGDGDGSGNHVVVMRAQVTLLICQRFLTGNIRFVHSVHCFQPEVFALHECFYALKPLSLSLELTCVGRDAYIMCVPNKQLSVVAASWHLSGLW